MFCVDVAINLPIKNLFRQYTYTVPDEFSFLDVGWRCVVNFGNQIVEGFVVRRVATPVSVEKLKPVQQVLGDEPWFDAEMLNTANWLAEYYMCSLAEAMRLFVPGRTSVKMREKTVFAYTITESGRNALAEGNNRAKAQIRALEVLANSVVPLTANELAEQGINQAILRVLVEKGQAAVSDKRILRDSYANKAGKDENLVLTDEQSRAVECITNSLAAQKADTYLLRGITGSGKTEVYLRVTAEALQEGKQVLILVPEIALTTQLVDRFKARFGEQIAVAHSKLSRNERGDVWYRMRNGSAKILIGVRSAVFAPFQNLGLIVIDEEHESSYKQEERPTYDARTVAAQRCKNAGGVLVLGSATPSLETYYHAQKGDYQELVLSKRPLGQPLPQVEIVDMRQELADKNYGVLSRKLKRELQNLVQGDEQAIVLLNRRGYSTFVMCRDCGYTVVCDHCAVAMVYHTAGNNLRCHYCGKTLPVPQECPQCHSKRIKYFGTGTQKAEEELGTVEGLKPLRMDQDSTRAKFAHEEIMSEFKSGKYNALVGTQMVAKGHDIPRVTLVGVLSADSSLRLPDYRAGERTFDLLTQAAGRAGRGSKPGKVIFQTYEAQSDVVQQAAKQDYKTFATLELQNRKEYRYPPFCQMLKLIVLDRDEQNGINLADRLVNFLRTKENAESNVEIMGPFPALVGKVRDYYRFIVLVKGEDLSPVKAQIMQSEFKDLRNIYFDVDPASII